MEIILEDRESAGGDKLLEERIFICPDNHTIY